MFDETADLYDLVYSWKDYEAEAARLCELVGREGATLLDVACGTGRHLALLAPHYRVEGVDVDPAMVELARQRGLSVRQGDFATLDLGRRFDVVTCLFSSIAYASDLDRVVGNLARHGAPGGVLVVEPWLAPLAAGGRGARGGGPPLPKPHPAPGVWAARLTTHTARRSGAYARRWFSFHPLLLPQAWRIERKRRVRHAEPWQPGGVRVHPA